MRINPISLKSLNYPAKTVSKTLPEAVDNAKIFIQEWLETAYLLNRPIPLPEDV